MLLQELLELFEAKQPSEMTKDAISKELDSLEDKYEDEKAMPPEVLKRHTDLSKAFQNGGWKNPNSKALKELSPEKRVSTRKHGGDDSSSWAVFVDGKMKINGLTKREATFYKTKFMKELK